MLLVQIFAGLDGFLVSQVRMRMNFQDNTPWVLEEDVLEASHDLILCDALDRSNLLQIAVETRFVDGQAAPVKGSFGTKTCTLLAQHVDLGSLDSFHLLLRRIPSLQHLREKLVHTMLKEVRIFNARLDEYAEVHEAEVGAEASTHDVAELFLCAESVERRLLKERFEYLGHGETLTVSLERVIPDGLAC